MQLDLTRYRRPLDRVSKRFEPEDLGEEQDAYRVTSPVELAFEIHKDKDRFRLVGRIATNLELTCSRCLEPFAFPLDAAFDLRYLPASGASTETERAIGDDDLETSYYRDDAIDLTELVVEQCYLALPMKPLCQEGCRGLCPVCGTNWNAGTCECGSSEPDPRLAGLGALRHES